ncbi:Protein of unknown function DUF295 [Macleaya cordata]|uniref:KIB1-4 beta-propeller domain-containing protein n=1 Tax=Macleaya cordata TaxID=56857 RepID=A0A200R018_MACCD|nr:Protein of unknown function DUF295 [Macleaya cordata]
MAPEWAQLHPDLIQAIANRITAYIDYIRFRAVCVSWNSAVPKFPNHHHHLPPQIPWLMVPFMGDETESYRCFFSISEDKYHILELPECSEKRICGSSLGWLLMLEKGPAINLFNPITRTLIPLPPLTTFPHVVFRPSKFGKEFKVFYTTEDSEPYSLKTMQNYFIRKMVLSSSPKNDDMEEDDNYMVVVILRTREMAFMRKGDQVWTLVKDPEFCFEDVIFHKGQCFGLDSDRGVVVCDFDGPSPKLNVVSSGPQGEFGDYLVDFFGDLLLVSRTREHNHNHTLDYTTTNFRVFKPDQSLPGWHWHEVKDLGDRVLFLGPNSSMSLLVHEFSGCQRNCIYFADDNYDSHYLVDEDYDSDDSDEIGAHDLGIFNLYDGSIEPSLYLRRNNWLIWPPPTWVTPNPS